MKLKTSLIAAATLAVGVISSQAQVYSQNIVGYMNQTVLNSGKFNLFTLQFNIGTSNGLNEIFSGYGTNQNNNVIYFWDNAGQTFKAAGYQWYNDPASPSTPGAWYDQAGNGNEVTTFPTFKPGQAFFIQGNGGGTTDVLSQVGSVPLVGATNTQYIVGNQQYTLLGSQIPVGGGLYTLGFNPPDNTVVYPWDAASGAFSGSGGYQFESGVNNGQYGGWYDQGGNGNVITNTGVLFTNGGFAFSDLVIKAGQGFYIQGGTPNGVGSTNWTQSLIIQ